MTLFRTCLAVAAFLLLQLLAYVASSPLYLAEDEQCSDGGVAGICRRVRHCEPAQRALRERRPLPSRCSFAGYEEVVCCVDGANGIDFNDEYFQNGDKDRGNDGDNNIVNDDGWKKPTSDRPSVAACKAYIRQRSGLTYHILNGENARDGEFPHMAALGYQVPGTDGLSWLCGGTLISDQYVLTAAHCCTSRLTRRPLRVQLGTLDVRSDEDSDSLYRIKDIIIHPNYKRPYYANDIALLRLDRKVPFSDTTFPACLYTANEDPPNFTATGWGATTPSGTRMSSLLMKTTISPFPLSACQSTYKNKFPGGLDSSVICAGDPEGKADTCVGDSGGPLQVSEKGVPCSVIGITSVGPKPCGGTVPSVYTRVSNYLDWIERNVWP